MDEAQGPASGYSLTSVKHRGSLDALIQSEPPAFGVSLPALAGQTFQPLYCTFFSQPFFTHSSVLTWKSHRERTLGVTRVGHYLATKHFFIPTSQALPN